MVPTPLANRMPMPSTTASQKKNLSLYFVWIQDTIKATFWNIQVSTCRVVCSISTPNQGKWCSIEGTKPHHILVVVAHFPMKGRCIGNCGVRSPFSNMRGMFFGLVFLLLVLECYLVKFSWSIDINWYALLHPKLLENTFGVMTFNHPKMYEQHDRPPYVLACYTICGQGTQIILVWLLDNLQWSNRCKQPY